MTKMGKSLLLGTVAGLLTVAGAQAADMPVKAKPVQYVKVCSLYGSGFYYIPGTDTCLKIGGYVRVQTHWNAGASGQVYGTGGVQGSGRYDRADSNDINWTVRAVTRSMRARRPTTAPCGPTSAPVGPRTRREPLVRAPRLATTARRTTACPTGIARSFSSRASRSVARSPSSTSSPMAVLTPTSTSVPGVTPVRPAWTSGPTRCNSVTACRTRSHSRTLRPWQERHLRQYGRRLLPLPGWGNQPTTVSSIRAPATTASGFRTSSPTCASIRPGAISVSAPRSTM